MTVASKQPLSLEAFMAPLIVWQLFVTADQASKDFLLKQGESLQTQRREANLHKNGQFRTRPCARKDG